MYTVFLKNLNVFNEIRRKPNCGVVFSTSLGRVGYLDWFVTISCTINKTLERKCTRMANLRVNDFRVDRNETNTHRKTLQRDSKRSNQLNGRCTLFSVMEVETQKKKPTIDAPPCGRNDEKRRPNNQ